jgi:hypothetical protein
LAPEATDVTVVPSADDSAAVRVLDSVAVVTAKAVAVAVLLELQFAVFDEVKAAFSDSLAAIGIAAVVQVAVPELTATAPHPVIVVGVTPDVKFTVPAAPVPAIVAVNVTLVPRGSVVTAVAGEAASPTFSAVVVVTAVTAKATAVALELAVKAARFVGAKVAFRDSLVATGSAEVVQVAVFTALTVVTGWAPHPVIVVGVVPDVKLTVPAAPAPVTVAVSVTLAPKGSVVIAVAGEAASPIFSAVVVVTAVMVTTGSGEVLAAYVAFPA